MTKVIAIANQKGGVGKTSTTVNLRAGLVRKDFDVLLIDLDSQANLTMALGYQKQENNSAMYGRTGAVHGGKSQTDLKLPVATSLAMVYSPIQVWRDIYDMDYALERGTLFAELDKPLCSAGK